MKTSVLSLLFFTFTIGVFSQVGVGTTTPNANAELDVTSPLNNKGLLIPRMTAVQRIAIPTIAADAGLLVFQTDVTGQVGLWFWSGTQWIQNSVPSWSVTGNSGTLPATNFIGTTDAQPLVFRTQLIERMRITPSASGGFLGIGTNAPTAKLHLVGIGAIINYNGFETGAIAPYTDGPTITGGAWTATGNAGDFTVGARGAQSGTGVTSSISQMQYVFTAAAGGTVSFDVKVDSEANRDFFNFRINGVLLTSGSGNIPFTPVSFPFAAGTNTLVWEYTKDFSLNIGTDRVYVDNVNIVSNTSALRIVDGTQGVGKVLTSDANGVGTWTTPTVAGGTSWQTGGNAGTTPATNFIGTLDNQGFTVRTNNLPRITVTPTGNVGIGLVAPLAKLDVSENLVGQGIIRGSNTNTTTGSISYGIFGQAAATAIGSAGVIGISTAGGSNEIGVLGDYATWGAGVFGKGPLGTFTDMQNLIDHGVFGTVGNSATGIGVYGKSTLLTAGNFGMYCNGNFAVTGTKSASVPTSQGNQLVYCTESPELWFEDLGFGTLANGSLHIRLDDMFLETIHIDTANKMHVFLQEEGDSNGLFVTMDADNKGFTVKEKQNGRSNNSFSYRILAKRRFYQNHRFGVDASQPFENNLVKHKDVPAPTTNPQEMKRFVDEYTASRTTSAVKTPSAK